MTPTKYDNLDAYTELEQTIAKDLFGAFGKRGFTIKHNGTATRPAKSGLSDIEMWTGDLHIDLEVTKTIRSSADREMLSVADHLATSKKSYPRKKCLAVYISPETHYRMVNAIRDHNIVRQGLSDQKIMPLSFTNFEVFITKLTSAHKDEYKAEQITKLFDNFLDFVDDERVLRVLYQELFNTDDELGQTLQRREIEKWQRLESQIMKDLEQIEEALRRDGIALHLNAIKQLIYLVFIKLYEERKEAEGRGRNWFTVKSFLDFQEAQGEKETKRATHGLFEQIKAFTEFQQSGLLTKYDLLAEKLTDDFVLHEVIQRLERYPFLKAKVDGLGAVYEVLGRRSGKDTKAGQFFTPANVVDFMVRLAELDSSDTVLDPACGTGRFLIWAMDDMQKKVSGHDINEQRERIARTQLLGTDNDPDVAKLAKMNMYIHGDGKGNIWDDDGLLLYKTRNLDGKIDVVLTNPPLGDLGYKRPYFDDEFYRRMIVIPRKVTVSDNNQEDICVSGNQMKGGAQFINAIYHYLKPVRDPSLLPEWRGGKMLIILDEAILNTDDYAHVRRFIRDRFYIKAIISLTRDTFVPVSRTTTKTSILYAIKKDDPTAKQQEPIFYAHAEKVGIDTRRRTCANDLFNEGQNILMKFLEFKGRVLASYDGLHFNRKKFDFPGGILDNA
jgi:type I restriction-modification system DNA methylase subunit